MSDFIVLLGALDTKGNEFAFVRAEIERRGHRTLVVDTGIMGEPGFAPEVAAAEVAQAGGASLASLRAAGDRGAAVAAMARGAAAVVRRLYEDGRLDAILAMGGSAGTGIAAAAMRALPIGVPKVLVSTLVAGDVSPIVGVSDIVLMPSVVDVAGINRVSARVYANAAGAIVGMVETPAPALADRPLLAASMFGNTTKLVDRARGVLEARGYEVLVFHATGTGGRVLESLVDGGFVGGVLDVTTTEWADELAGGILSAGPERLDAAARRGVPQVIAPGCLDMVNFGPRESVSERYADRKFYVWGPTVTLMRTTPAENAELGRILAQKVNRTTGPAAFLLPLRGVSMLDAPGGEFWWPEADQALFAAIKANVRAGIPVIELDCNINEPAFADAAAQQLLAFLT